MGLCGPPTPPTEPTPTQEGRSTHTEAAPVGPGDPEEACSPASLQPGDQSGAVMGPPRDFPDGPQKPRRVSGGDCWVTRQTECGVKAGCIVPGILGPVFLRPLVWAGGGECGVLVLCLDILVDLRPSQMSPSACRTLSVSRFSSRHPGVQTRHSCMGDTPQGRTHLSRCGVPKPSRGPHQVP